MEPNRNLRVRLGSVASVKARLGWKGLKAGEYTRTGCYFLSTPNIKGHRIDFDRANFISQWRYDESPEIQLTLNDVLLVKDGSTLGTANLVRDLPGPTTVNGSIAVVRSREQLVPQYLFQVVKGNDFQDLIRLKKAGLGVPHLFQADLREFQLMLPTKVEQRAVAAVLDALDDAIYKTEQIIAKLQQVKQGLLHDLLTRGIDDNGELRDPERHPEQFQDSPLGQIPKAWEVGTVASLLADVDPAMRSGPFGSALLKHELVKEGVPLLGIDNVHVERFVADFTRFVAPQKCNELCRYLVRPRDVMITVMGTVGRCCVVPDDVGRALSSKHVWTLTFDESRYPASLACVQFNYAPWVLRHFACDEQGAVMGAIRSETLRSTIMPIPRPAEARAIAARLDEISSRIRREERAIAKQRLLKSGLAEDLLTGRVRTTSLGEVTP